MEKKNNDDIKKNGIDMHNALSSKEQKENEDAIDKMLAFICR